ncbi:uncharacterized protein METZ01_LOCUS468961 [marine metagenome]|uniref:Uncharacterized protein n=1 Tax=marine metagenome TaxID=408172 RepID=A0A383B7K2_9ZZZZ
MPCKDTTSKITVLLDLEDRIKDYDFSKITCRKEIGGLGSGKYWIGQNIDKIESMDFNKAVDKLGLTDTQDQFLFYLEWDALWTAIAQYRGKASDIDNERYQLSSISYDEEEVKIIQVIRPLKEMPKIIPCRVRNRSHANQSG